MNTEIEKNQEIEEHVNSTSEGNSKAEQATPEPSIDYSKLSPEEAVEKINDFNTEDEILENKANIEILKKVFYDFFNAEMDKIITMEDEEGNIAQDQLYLKKSAFDKKYFEIKDIQKKYYKKLESNQKNNLQVRLDLIEELKNLISPENTTVNKFNAFKDIQERWRNAGACPKDKYNHVWNSYHFHVENFFDYIHLDKDARDLEFKNNYEKRVALLNRLNELLEEKDLKKALSEIRLIQKAYREDLGPVEKSKRQELWDQFDAINAKVAEKRKELKVLLGQEEKENLVKKNALIQEINALTIETQNSIDFWTKQNKKLQKIKDAFMAVGRTPKANNEETWASFRAALKNFNTQKNEYFKKLREEQQVNIDKKKALIAQAKEVENSEDWAEATEKVKRLQSDWKKIGYVPTKYSNPLWKEFKATCDNYFNRFHAQQNAANEKELEAFKSKEKFLKSVNKTDLPGIPEEDIQIIQEVIDQWNELGRVPFSKKGIQEDFNKAIDALYGKVNLDPQELEVLRYKSYIEGIIASGDNRKLLDEEQFISKKINEERNEINQLETNISFFSSGKKENPFLKEVEKNIAQHKENFEKWKLKLGLLRNLKQ